MCKKTNYIVRNTLETINVHWWIAKTLALDIYGCKLKSRPSSRYCLSHWLNAFEFEIHHLAKCHRKFIKLKVKIDIAIDAIRFSVCSTSSKFGLSLLHYCEMRSQWEIPILDSSQWWSKNMNLANKETAGGRQERDGLNNRGAVLAKQRTLNGSIEKMKWEKKSIDRKTQPSIAIRWTKMLELEKQKVFLKQLVLTRNQSQQCIALRCDARNGKSDRDRSMNRWIDR